MSELAGTDTLVGLAILAETVVLCGMLLVATRKIGTMSVDGNREDVPVGL